MKLSRTLLACFVCIGLFGGQAAHAINPQPLPPRDPNPDAARTFSSSVGNVESPPGAVGSFAQASARSLTLDSQSTGPGAGKFVPLASVLTPDVGAAEALDTFSAAAVPEPASAGLWLLGLAALVVGTRRRGSEH